ncbi:hypothetical protein [Actinoallomurus sp. CA-150999]|uniref:WXG100-like domain-containing protein n=1 Tax=Actinoallomurus sp. CA-150999 TaxID=3239887 RepID=UPI003D8E0DE0
MGLTLPGQLETLLNDLGFTWPEIDEERLLSLGHSWSAYGSRLQQISRDAQSAAEEVWSGNSGPAVERFKSRWEHEESPARVLSDGATAAHALGAVLMVCAAVVLALKVNVIVQLSILLAEIIEAVATAAVTFGASLLEIPVFKEIQQRIVNAIINEAINTILGAT